MSTFEPVSTTLRADIPALVTYCWKGLKNLETGAPMKVDIFRAISIQVEGEFHGFQVQIEGSNDGEHWYVLVDSQDNHMRLSEPTLANVGQYCRFLRPEVIGGDEFTNVSVWVVCRGL